MQHDSVVRGPTPAKPYSDNEDALIQCNEKGFSRPAEWGFWARICVSGCWATAMRSFAPTISSLAPKTMNGALRKSYSRTSHT